jgi:ubiquinone/menaquinone biosynthesis C-methylase UbiE
MNSNDSSQWSSFWRQGFITTFGASKPNNYDGVVQEFWFKHFAGLPNGARVLDIATGNGAIATLAADFSSQFAKNFAITATDLAEVNDEIIHGSSAQDARQNIRFISHMPCEQQPFEDNSFDLVTSQFGFEYSNTELTLGEVRRVLKPGGKFAAISHHVESGLIENSRKELEVYQSALDELDLFGLFRKYLVIAGDLSGSQQQFTQAIKKASPYSRKINEAVELFRQRHPNNECASQMVNAISHFARNARNTEYKVLMAEVRAAEQDFNFARARLRDMLDASLGEEQIGKLKSSAVVAGFDSVTIGLLYGEDGVLGGWQIEMT